MRVLKLQFTETESHGQGLTFEQEETGRYTVTHGVATMTNLTFEEAAAVLGRSALYAAEEAGFINTDR